MDVGDLLELQGPFQGNSVINAPSDKEDTAGRQIAVGEFLYLVLIVQHHFHLGRQFLQLLDHLCKTLIGQFSPDMGKFHSQEIKSDQLGGVGLCGGHGDLRSSPRVHDIVRLPGNGASHYVYDTKHSHALGLSLPQSRQRICRLSGLAHHDEKRALLKDRIPVAELRSQIHLHRDPGQALKHILTCHACVVG